MKRALTAACLLISWLMLGCVAMDAGEDLTSDESAVIVDPPPPPLPADGGLPVPVPPLPTPPRSCVQECQEQLATCKASATSPLAWCMCQTIEARCLGGCGVLAPMPRCFAM